MAFHGAGEGQMSASTHTPLDLLACGIGTLLVSLPRLLPALHHPTHSLMLSLPLALLLLCSPKQYQNVARVSTKADEQWYGRFGNNLEKARAI